MTAGLKWWHNVCREVRESGSRYGQLDRETLVNQADGPPDNGIVEECVETAVAEWDGHYPGTGIPSQQLKHTELKFLRTAWVAAYRKARNGNS